MFRTIKNTAGTTTYIRIDDVEVVYELNVDTVRICMKSGKEVEAEGTAEALMSAFRFPVMPEGF